jgi:hypothetical protein
VQKIVINACYGGFDLTDIAMAEYLSEKTLGVFVSDIYYPCEIPRDDPILVKMVENPDFKNATNTRLKVVEIPDGVDWIICANDGGKEWIAERHRTWS